MDVVCVVSDELLHLHRVCRRARATNVCKTWRSGDDISCILGVIYPHSGSISTWLFPLAHKTAHVSAITFAIINADGALAEKLGSGLQNRADGSVTRRCLHSFI